MAIRNEIEVLRDLGVMRPAVDPHGVVQGDRQVELNPEDSQKVDKVAEAAAWARFATAFNIERVDERSAEVHARHAELAAQLAAKEIVLTAEQQLAFDEVKAAYGPQYADQSAMWVPAEGVATGHSTGRSAGGGGRRPVQRQSREHRPKPQQ